MSRYVRFETAENPDISVDEYKGFISQDFLNGIKDSDYTIFTIPLKFQYRPDLISYIYYDTPFLDFILTYANEINDSPEGFYVGREIKVPNRNYVENLGVN